MILLVILRPMMWKPITVNWADTTEKEIQKETQKDEEFIKKKLSKKEPKKELNTSTPSDTGSREISILRVTDTRYDENSLVNTW